MSEDTTPTTREIFGVTITSRRFNTLAALTTVSTFVLMLLGAYTKAIGAGLACPDWPTCYGGWIPFLRPGGLSDVGFTWWQVFAEWAHRGLAMITGFLLIGTAIAAWKAEWLPRLGLYGALLAVVVLPFQVLLGGLTVTEKLDPVIVTAHLGAAMVIFSGILVATMAGYWAHDLQSGRGGSGATAD